MNTSDTQDTTNYGATYCTESGADFGKITHVFPVAADWDGYRYHGYCIPTSDEVSTFMSTQ